MIEKIRNAKPEELNELLRMLTERYRECFPDWEIHVFTLEKKNDKNQQIDAVIGYLEKLR